MVTSTGEPSLRLTLCPFSSVNVFSMRTSRYNWWPDSTLISTVSAGCEDSDGRIFYTVPGRVTLGFPGILNHLHPKLSLTLSEKTEQYRPLSTPETEQLRTAPGAIKRGEQGGGGVASPQKRKRL